MSIRVQKLINILEQYDPQAFVMVYDAMFKEFVPVDTMTDRIKGEDIEVVISIKED